jgi:hypothetical protein
MHTEAQPALQLTLSSLVTSLVDSVTPLIVEGLPEKVVLMACQLLLSLVYTVRPRFAMSLPALQGLMERAAQGKLTALPSKVSEERKLSRLSSSSVEIEARAEW